ncbi:MAG: YdjY domain-containing protein [Pirellulaceae bacterium]
MRPDADVSIDAKNTQIILRAGVCLRKGSIELFACVHQWIKGPLTGKEIRRGTKEYESIVTINAPAAGIYTGLLAIGARNGSPVHFAPEYQAAHGSPIEVTLHWQDIEGKSYRAKAQDWIRNTKNKQALAHDWVFGGSRFVKAEGGGKEYYSAENGNVIFLDQHEHSSLLTGRSQDHHRTQRCPPHHGRPHEWPPKGGFHERNRSPSQWQSASGPRGRFKTACEVGRTPWSQLSGRSRSLVRQVL